MMIAPALPWPAAVDSVLMIAANPAAPAVTAGIPMGAATAAAPAVVAAVFYGEPVEVAQDVPPRTVSARVALDDEELVVLVLDVAGINSEAVQDGGLHEQLGFVAPAR